MSQACRQISGSLFLSGDVGHNFLVIIEAGDFKSQRLEGGKRPFTLPGA